MPFCGFSASNRLLCGAIAASTRDSRKYYCRKWSEFLGGGASVGYGDGGGSMLPLPLVVEQVRFGFREKNERGAEVRLVLLPLITQGLLPQLP